MSGNDIYLSDITCDLFNLKFRQTSYMHDYVSVSLATSVYIAIRMSVSNSFVNNSYVRIWPLMPMKFYVQPIV